MIQRSGLSARNFRPISAATSRTRSTTFLSSVSGMVKNCGAWGSIAPPTTVEIIGFSIRAESIVQFFGQQAEQLEPPSARRRFTGAKEDGRLRRINSPALSAAPQNLSAEHNEEARWPRCQ